MYMYMYCTNFNYYKWVWLIANSILFLNLGSGDIVGGNLKLILGLVWTLILHYQISVGFGIEDGKGKGKKTTPKQALLGYVNVCITCANDGCIIIILINYHPN